MKLSKKQISLGTLAAVTVIVVPVVAVISCGSKDDEQSMNTESIDSSLNFDSSGVKKSMEITKLGYSAQWENWHFTTSLENKKIALNKKMDDMSAVVKGLPDEIYYEYESNYLSKIIELNNEAIELGKEFRSSVHYKVKKDVDEETLKYYSEIFEKQNTKMKIAKEFSGAALTKNLKNPSQYSHVKDITELDFGDFDGNVTGFSGLTGLTKITGNKITKIGADAFSGVTALDSLNLPSIESVGKNAFGANTFSKIELGSKAKKAFDITNFNKAFGKLSNGLKVSIENPGNAKVAYPANLNSLFNNQNPAPKAPFKIVFNDAKKDITPTLI